MAPCDHQFRYKPKPYRYTFRYRHSSIYIQTLGVTFPAAFIYILGWTKTSDPATPALSRREK